MSLIRSVLISLGLGLATLEAHAAPVLMISIDGLRPADVLDAQKRGLKVPVLTDLVAHGLYATSVRNALPTVTYPNHTTLITGVWPQKHGIVNNLTFDPLQTNMAGWYWYSKDIKVPTLWDAVHEAHGTSASFSWPVSVGASHIDYNLPEYWRAKNADDLKLISALSSPGLIDEMEALTGLGLNDAVGDSPEADDGRARFAGAVIKAKHPLFVTLHLAGLDHMEHVKGPGSPKANAVLEKLDATVGRLISQARQAEPDVVIAIVSDHGFAPIHHDVNLMRYFIEAGLIKLDPLSHKPSSWEASLWGGSSVAVVLAHPHDDALKAKVKTVLDQIVANKDLGIDHIADEAEIAELGGAPEASFWIDFKPGYEMGQDPSLSPLSPGLVMGTHGYFPTHSEMRATFILSGRNLPKHGALGEIDMRDIAPTLAKIMQVSLPEADGKPLF